MHCTLHSAHRQTWPACLRQVPAVLHLPARPAAECAAQRGRRLLRGAGGRPAGPGHRGRRQGRHRGQQGRQPAAGGHTAAQAGNCRPSRATFTIFTSYQENRYSIGKKIRRQV